jgi:hypothetical protein
MSDQQELQQQHQVPHEPQDYQQHQEAKEHELQQQHHQEQEFFGSTDSELMFEAFEECVLTEGKPENESCLLPSQVQPTPNEQNELSILVPPQCELEQTASTFLTMSELEDTASTFLTMSELEDESCLLPPQCEEKEQLIVLPHQSELEHTASTLPLMSESKQLQESHALPVIQIKIDISQATSQPNTSGLVDQNISSEHRLRKKNSKNMRNPAAPDKQIFSPDFKLVINAFFKEYITITKNATDWLDFDELEKRVRPVLAESNIELRPTFTKSLKNLLIGYIKTRTTLQSDDLIHNKKKHQNNRIYYALLKEATKARGLEEPLSEILILNITGELRLFIDFESFTGKHRLIPAEVGVQIYSDNYGLVARFSAIFKAIPEIEDDIKPSTIAAQVHIHGIPPANVVFQKKNKLKSASPNSIDTIDEQLTQLSKFLEQYEPNISHCYAKNTRNEKTLLTQFYQRDPHAYSVFQKIHQKLSDLEHSEDFINLWNEYKNNTLKHFPDNILWSCSYHQFQKKNINENLHCAVWDTRFYLEIFKRLKQNNQRDDSMNDQRLHQWKDQRDEYINDQRLHQWNDQPNKKLNNQMNDQRNYQWNDQPNKKLNNQMNDQHNHQWNDQRNHQWNDQRDDYMNDQRLHQWNDQPNHQWNDTWNSNTIHTHSHLPARPIQQRTLDSRDRNRGSSPLLTQSNNRYTSSQTHRSKRNYSQIKD